MNRHVTSSETLQRLSGRVVLVTGAGNGIGRAEALLFAAQGASVVVNDIGLTVDGRRRADVVVAEVDRKGGRAVVSSHDISTFGGAQDAVDTALQAFGRIDVLVNNAGLRAQNNVGDLSEEEFDRVVDSHLKGTYGMIRAVVPSFLTQGGGVILNTGSEAGLGMPFNTAYAAAKEGIAGLTRSVARELGGQGVRCNMIRPRADTDRGPGSGDRSPEYTARRARFDERRRELGRFSLGERGDILYKYPPEVVAHLAVWLCTDAAAELNGEEFQVAGNEVGRWEPPRLTRLAFMRDGWRLDDLDNFMAMSVTQGISRRF